MAVEPGGITTGEGTGSPKSKGIIRSWKNTTWHSNANKIFNISGIESEQSVGTPLRIGTINRSIYGISGVGTSELFGSCSIHAPGEYDWLTYGYAYRIYDWFNYCGIPGGIPTRETIYTTLGIPGQLPSFIQSVTAAEINAAIAACPNGQVVLLSPGRYSIGQIYFPHTKVGCTLRGAGPGQTTIISSAVQAIVNAGYSHTEAQGISLLPIVSGGTHIKGSLVITLSSTPTANFAEGQIMVVTQDNNRDTFAPGLGVFARVTEPPIGNDPVGTIYGLSATRHLFHVTRIISVNTTERTVTMATPLPWTYTDSLNPRAYPPNGVGNTSLCGIESLTIDCNTGDRALSFEMSDRCWLKNVEVMNCEGTTGQVVFITSVQPEVRRCYVHDVVGFPANSDGYGVMLYYGTCNGRVEDNIFDRTAQPIMMNGSGHNAVLYNYGPRHARVGTPGNMWISGHLSSNHGPHGIMSLHEGNIIEAFINDGYHGSASFDMIFRNYISGYDEDPLVNRDRHLIRLERGSYYCSCIGNVLGHPSYPLASYEATGSIGHDWDQGNVYVLGYQCNGMGQWFTEAFNFQNYWSIGAAGTDTTHVRIPIDGKHAPIDDYYNGATIQNWTLDPDPFAINYAARAVITDYDADDGAGHEVFTLATPIYGQIPGHGFILGARDYGVISTLLRHGNYDYYGTGQTRWDPNITSHSIPSSLFYNSKPSYFGSLSWPAIGPDVSPMVNLIPAKHRWDTWRVSGLLSDLFADEI